MTAPRIMRADTDDELWRRGTGQDQQEGMPTQGQRAEAPQTPAFGMPYELQFDLATSTAQEQLIAKEEDRAANQLKQPELSNGPTFIDEPGYGATDEVRVRSNVLNLVPERQINLTILRGEQDSANKTSYSEWTRDAKDHMKSRGAQGRALVSILEWAERMGDVHITNEALNKLGMSEALMRQMEHAV